jgi:glycosyltransferase involved in cell wall biosynthesis
VNQLFKVARGSVAQVGGRSPDAPARIRNFRRVCMVTHSFYESDNRVIRYAEAMAQRGDSVEVFALGRSPEVPKEEVISGVRVFRIQDRFGKGEKSLTSFLLPVLRFLITSSWWVMRRHHVQRFDLVHVHNIPDFLVFAAWYPKLLGAKVILDIHDIVPEFFASKFAAPEGSNLVRGLRLVEKMSAGFADHVIVSNHLWLDKYVARSAPREKCSVFINHVDSRIFRRRPPIKKTGNAIVLFPGGLEWHQGLDIAIRALQKLLSRTPDVEFHIYGDGIMKPKLEELAKDLGLGRSVQFFKPLRLHEIAEVMAKADLGVVPKRANSFGNEAYSTKIMEFMSVGVPTVVSNTKIDRYYFDDSGVRFFESGNADALADAMYDVLQDPQIRCDMVERGLQYVSLNCWENRKLDYLRLVDSLCSRK